jgi:hypothetical protein
VLHLHEVQAREAAAPVEVEVVEIRGDPALLRELWEVDAEASQDEPGPVESTGRPHPGPSTR